MILNMDLSGLNKAASLMFTNPEENNETPHFLVNHAGIHHMDASLKVSRPVVGNPMILQYMLIVKIVSLV